MGVGGGDSATCSSSMLCVCESMGSIVVAHGSDSQCTMHMSDRNTRTRRRD